MTSEEIKKAKENVQSVARSLPLVTDDGLPNVAGWLAEIAYQLAVMNEKK
jgi:hypothetical protein